MKCNLKAPGAINSYIVDASRKKKLKRRKEKNGREKENRLAEDYSSGRVEQESEKEREIEIEKKKRKGRDSVQNSFDFNSGLAASLILLPSLFSSSVDLADCSFALVSFAAKKISQLARALKTQGVLSGFVYIMCFFRIYLHIIVCFFAHKSKRQRKIDR